MGERTSIFTKDREANKRGRATPRQVFYFLRTLYFHTTYSHTTVALPLYQTNRFGYSALACVCLLRLQLALELGQATKQRLG